MTAYSASSTFLNSFMYVNVKEDNRELGRFLRDRYPAVIGDAFYIYSAIRFVDKYDVTKNNMEFHESIDMSAHKTIENNLIVLVVGESSLFSRYSAYGYNKETTPNMKKIFSQPYGCIINNVHSSAPLTRDSVSMTLAFHTPESDESLFKNKSIIEMAKHKGYKTFWIGSQPLKGLYDSKYGFIAKKSHFTKLTDYQDDELKNILKEILSDNAKHKFIVIHLWGNHKPYSNFDEEDKIALSNTNDYDLTIYHTDRVIKSLHDVIKENSKNYVILYTSDHGEIVGKGHGFLEGKDQYLIPFMYKSMNQNYDCQFIESFRNKNGWLSGLMNKFILSNLLGYTINKNILEREINNDRVLYANGRPVDFSKLE